MFTLREMSLGSVPCYLHNSVSIVMLLDQFLYFHGIFFGNSDALLVLFTIFSPVPVDLLSFLTC